MDSEYRAARQEEKRKMTDKIDKCSEKQRVGETVLSPKGSSTKNKKRRKKF